MTALLAALVAALVTALLPRWDRRGLLAPRLAQGTRLLPRVGGPALLVALVLAPVLISLTSRELADALQSHRRELTGLLIAATLIVALGILDDRQELSFKAKFLGQAVAAAVLFIFDYRLDRIAFPWGPALDLGPFSPVVTLLWLVFITNAVNLIDGKDGVAAGVCILAGAALAVVADNSGQLWVAGALLAITGGAAGFLPFNWPPATRLLGDSGALLLGLMLAALAIKGAKGPEGAVFISIPAIALGFPVADTVLAFTRRILDQRNPFRGDLDHIHHRLEQSLGLGPWGILMPLYALSALFAGAALALHFIENDGAETLVLVAFLFVVCFSLYRLGYARSLWESSLLRSLRGRRERLEAPQQD